MNTDPRNRIKRPDMPQYEPEPVASDNTEELSQDDLNEWVVQKIIRLELDQFRKEAKPIRPATAERIEVPKQPERPKPKVQPYESMYGKTEDEVAPPAKKPGRNKKMIILALIIGLAAYLTWLGYQYFVLGYTLPGG